MLIIDYLNIFAGFKKEEMLRGEANKLKHLYFDERHDEIEFNDEFLSTFNSIIKKIDNNVNKLVNDGIIVLDSPEFQDLSNSIILLSNKEEHIIYEYGSEEYNDGVCLILFLGDDYYNIHKMFERNCRVNNGE